MEQQLFDKILQKQNELRQLVLLCNNPTMRIHLLKCYS